MKEEIIARAVEIICTSSSAAEISGLLYKSTREQLTDNQMLWIIKRLEKEPDGPSMAHCVYRMQQSFEKSGIDGIRTIINEAV
ncbi:hypothetical protein KAR91_66735 [Candidatus Pacearchaeota archaeon]|nr:hypothetical protein [Candidatus Pacearchaeota archaeon]